MSHSLAVIVPAGGRSVRFGHPSDEGGEPEPDKLGADLDGRSVLDVALAGLPAHADIVCVGPQRPTRRPVTWVREEPAHAGPLAAVAAGLAALHPDATQVGLVGGDMPAAGNFLPSLGFALAAARAKSPATQPDGVVAADATGRLQPLLSIWSRQALVGVLRALGDLAGRPLHALLDEARVGSLGMPPMATDDIDTPMDLDQARRRSADRPPASGQDRP